MKMELNTIASESMHYLESAWFAVHPLLKYLATILVYILFPMESYETYAMILGVVVVLDLVSKYYAISASNGGMRNALKIGKLSSSSMWVGTRKKLVSYFLIMILVGLSYRFESLQTPAEFMGTIVYAVMFLREAQSILENLVEAGHTEVKWALFFMRSKEKKVFENAGMTTEEIAEMQKKTTTTVTAIVTEEVEVVKEPITEIKESGKNELL